MYPEGELVRYTFSIRSRRHYRLVDTPLLFSQQAPPFLHRRLRPRETPCTPSTVTRMVGQVQPALVRIAANWPAAGYGPPRGWGFGSVAPPSR
ncbi:hypothetical protein Hamer_G005665 [Homarus americanus]|uniref:Uncharacterized protein n=1 Tax=Homarus americanus TaxID=6706 RepID=A0A8J5JYZ7_HOMAM|nr:hypothetical protein Hamer_G005665 [Homarus americanus]